MLECCTLGTGGALPLPTRALSSLYVRVNGRGLLIDCGEGTQTGVRRLGWGFINIDALLLTHYHADHCGGLPGLLLSIAKAKRTQPLHLYGPVGLRRVFEGLMVVAPTLTFPVILHELTGTEPPFSAIGLDVTPFPLHHSVPCLGYRLYLPRQAAFDPDKARALGVPLPLWRQLQRGVPADVDGRLVFPAEVTGAPRRGLTLLYATDTRPVEAVVRMGREADLMILEGMYGDDGKRAQALKNRHMIFHEAAELARAAQAQRLALTHFSTCIDDPQVYLPGAQAIFPNTIAAYDGMCINLDYPKA